MKRNNDLKVPNKKGPANPALLVAKATTNKVVEIANKRKMINYLTINILKERI